MTLTLWDRKAYNEIKAMLDKDDTEIIDQTDLIDMIRKWTERYCHESYNEGYDDAIHTKHNNNKKIRHCERICFKCANGEEEHNCPCYEEVKND